MFTVLASCTSAVFALAYVFSAPASNLVIARETVVAAGVARGWACGTSGGVTVTANADALHACMIDEIESIVAAGAFRVSMIGAVSSCGALPIFTFTLVGMTERTAWTLARFVPLL